MTQEPNRRLQDSPLLLTSSERTLYACLLSSYASAVLRIAYQDWEAMWRRVFESIAPLARSPGPHMLRSRQGVVQLRSMWSHCGRHCEKRSGSTLRRRQRQRRLRLHCKRVLSSLPAHGGGCVECLWHSVGHSSVVHVHTWVQL